MKPASLPSNEVSRLEALHGLAILDTAPEPMFDDIARMAATVCGTPIALLSLVDGQRQWFKARVGLEAPETSRELAFCAHAILAPEAVLEVPDAHDDQRFADNPLVTGDPNIRFYAGAPVVTEDGHALGTVCAIDRQPRQLTPAQRDMLQMLARQASLLLAWRQRVRRTQEDLVHAWRQDRWRLEQVTRSVSHSLDLSAFVDRDGIYRFVNDRFLAYWGRRREEVEGKPVGSLAGWAQFEKAVKPPLDQVWQGKTVSVSRLIDFPGVGPRHMEVTYAPALDDQGQIFGAVIRGQDVNDLRQTQTGLEQALAGLTERSERQQQFIYMVSHDLREPANAVANFSGLLVDAGEQAVPDARHRRYLSYVLEGALRMRTMLDDLLQYVRLESAQAQEAMQPVALADVLNQVLSDLAGPIASQRAVIEGGFTGRVRAQETLLRLLIQNLLSNAVKFHQPQLPPRVVLTSHEEGRYVVFEVQDHGIGIPEFHMPKLFGFFRRHTSRKDYEGSGLGLAICKRIADLHGARLEIHSATGQGTRVSVYWPSADARQSDFSPLGA
jgi:signal transduction histidine kinase